MRLASYNVENLTDDARQDTRLEDRLAILAPQLKRMRADILCFQEVDATRPESGAPREIGALKRLAEASGYGDYHSACTVHPDTGHPRDKHNLVILSRWPVRDVRQMQNELVAPPLYRYVTAEPDAGELTPVLWDRPVLTATIELPGGRPLRLVNMHLKSPQASVVPGQKSGPFSWKTASGWAEGFYLATLKQAGQALEARLLIDSLFDSEPDALIAVVGDFNAQEGDAAFRILTAEVGDTGNGRLAGRTLVPLEHSLPESRRFTVIHRGRKLMLDHLLVSRALLGSYRGIEIHNEALTDDLVGATLVDSAPESFHAPVVAEFD